MSLKINPNLSIELASDIGNNKFLLCGHENLDTVIPVDFVEGNLFSKNYKTNDHILYHASLIHKDHDNHQEIGLGVFKREGKKCFIERYRSLYFIGEDLLVAPSERLHKFDCPIRDDEKVVVSSILPTKLEDLLYKPNTIITCNSPHIPTPVTINKDSLLVRYSAGLRSIKIFDVVMSTLCNFTKVLMLSCSRMLVPRVDTDYLVINPNDGKNAPTQEGSLYYNSARKCLTYYNGVEWKDV